MSRFEEKAPLGTLPVSRNEALAMKLKISGKSMKLDDTIKEHIERRVYFALSRFSPRIARVSVTIEDVNGTRGGIDKRCRILVKLNGLEEFSAASTEAKVHAAVAAAASRIGRTVQRKLERRRAVRRPRRRPGSHHPVDQESTSPAF